MKSPFSPQMNRRRFLGEASCASVGSAAFCSSLLNLQFANRAAAENLPQANDYRAVVCLFLGGGNDSYNMLIPREGDTGGSNTEYSRYQASRGIGDLALDALTDTVEITDPVSTKRYGLHNKMPEIRDLYNSGDLAFLANVGALVQPTTKAQYTNKVAPLPLGLFSHSDQQMHWQTSLPDTRGAFGWGGRMGDILGSLNDSNGQTNKISMNISLNGNNIFQRGRSVTPYAVSDKGAVSLGSYRPDRQTPFTTAIDSLLDQEYTNVLKKTYARFTQEALDSNNFFQTAIDNTGATTTQFPNTSVGRDLGMVARTIASRGALGMRRQTFFVEAKGWDHHDNVIDNQNIQLEEISKAVSAFWTEMGQLGLQDEVLLYTASDFGRTLSSNGKGSDHAWGGNQFILGGGINGGKIYGSYPDDLSLGGALDVDGSRGRILPTTSADEYFAEVACWMGVQNSQLATVLPNLDRFYSIGSASTPLGMFES